MDEIVTHRAAILHGLREIADGYDTILCDVWGVVHDGERANRPACEALERARGQGRTVILITNAPRPAVAVMRQIAGFGVGRSAYDAVVSSGDVTVALMQRHGREPFYFMGQDLDLGYLEDNWPKPGPLPPRAEIDGAAYVVCAGLVNDETERPEDYDGTLLAMHARGLTMICANPDVVVYRGSRLAPCAGALAARYEKLGGKAIYAGKPHAPIYEMALAAAEEQRGEPTPRRRVLAIGDAMHTDVAGAVEFGVDVLFVTNGIHRKELHAADGRLDRARYEQFLARADVRPRAAIADLTW